MPRATCYLPACFGVCHGLQPLSPHHLDARTLISTLKQCLKRQTVFYDVPEKRGLYCLGIETNRPRSLRVPYLHAVVTARPVGGYTLPRTKLCEKVNRGRCQGTHPEVPVSHIPAICWPLWAGSTINNPDLKALMPQCCGERQPGHTSAHDQHITIRLHFRHRHHDGPCPYRQPVHAQRESNPAWPARDFWAYRGVARVDQRV